MTEEEIRQLVASLEYEHGRAIYQLRQDVANLTAVVSRMLRYMEERAAYERR